MSTAETEITYGLRDTVYKPSHRHRVTAAVHEQEVFTTPSVMFCDVNMQYNADPVPSDSFWSEPYYLHSRSLDKLVRIYTQMS